MARWFPVSARMTLWAPVSGTTSPRHSHPMIRHSRHITPSWVEGWRCQLVMLIAKRPLSVDCKRCVPKITAWVPHCSHLLHISNISPQVVFTPGAPSRKRDVAYSQVDNDRCESTDIGMILQKLIGKKTSNTVCHQDQANLCLCRLPCDQTSSRELHELSKRLESDQLLDRREL